MKQGTQKKVESNARAGARSLNGLVAASFVPKDLSNILSIALGLLAFTVLLSYSLKVTAPYVMGENLVLAEIYLPGFVIKPITLFTYLFFVSFAFGLSSPISKARFLRMGDTLFELLYVLAWFLVMMSGFEVMYQIVLWSAGLAVQGLQNPDIIVNWWPANPYAINVVFAAKLVVLIFAMACFSVDYMRRMRTLREKAQS
ncbi:MAG: hypothetical protein ABSA81_08995 [Candidatus Bathyarchaeia archaeon]|jgi:hypothetical protein